MSLSETRTYFKARLSEMSGKRYREHKDAFNRDNIPKSQFDRSYHITIQDPVNNETNGCLIDESVNVQVELFFKGLRSPQDAYDKALDAAHELRRRAVYPGKWTGAIKGISADSIVPEPVGTNDNAIIVVANFTLRMLFEALP